MCWAMALGSSSGRVRRSLVALMRSTGIDGQYQVPSTWMDAVDTVDLTELIDPIVVAPVDQG